jgi:hypothetical protein
MKKAWSISGTVFEAGYLVVTLAPSRGTPQDAREWRELQRLMRGLARVERGWEWKVDRLSPALDVIFPQTAFFGWQHETSYDPSQKELRPGPRPYARLERDALFEAVAARMFDPELVRGLRGFRVCALDGCVDVYCVGKPWQRPNKSGRTPTVAEVRGPIAARSLVPFRSGLPRARRAR